MKEFIKLLIFIAMPAVLLIFLGGCKQSGCTDPSALNYDITASKDDGSCIVCERIKTTNSVDVFLYDQNFSSPKVVAVFHVTQEKNEYRYASCGNDSDACKIYYTIQSMVNQQMNFSYSLSSNGSLSFSTSFRSVTIPGFQTTGKDSVTDSFSSLCGTLSSSLMDVYTSGDIVYN